MHALDQQQNCRRTRTAGAPRSAARLLAKNSYVHCLLTTKHLPDSHLAEPAVAQPGSESQEAISMPGAFHEDFQSQGAQG